MSTGLTEEVSDGGQTPIHFRTYNIWNGNTGGLESALQGMGQANMSFSGFPGEKYDGRDIYLGISSAKLTPRRRLTFLSVLPHLHG